MEQTKPALLWEILQLPPASSSRDLLIPQMEVTYISPEKVTF